MFDKLTYKQKYRLLLIGLLLLSLFVVNNVFRKTVDAVIQNKELKTEQRRAIDAPKQLQGLQTQLAEADALLHDQKANDSTNIHERILGIVSNYCHENKITLTSYPEPVSSQEGDFITETNIVTVQGGFKKLLELLYLLEQKEKPAKISSVHFKSTKNFETKSIDLSAAIYLQTFKKNEP